uniref:protein O-GlcNAc transferase n=1 Tax=Magnetococcus massalia (strain MO-1) TaxID=451514 RepID=A0A1S7LNX4_MAGMO|nr:putative GT41 : related to UDP-GlcNAc : protein O-b-N-acetylglucosaminyltransferase [Candidatus Magnetococcus massalia]
MTHPPQDDAAIHTQLIQANRQHLAGQIAQAEALYNEILNRAPDHAVALKLAGTAALQLGKLEQAVQLLQRGIAVAPDDPELYANLGLVYDRLGDIDQAMAQQRHALALQGDYPEALSNLGSALLKKGLFHEAEAALQRALQQRADFPEAHLNLGQVLAKLGQFEQAIAHYRQALTSQPQNSALLTHLGLALAAKGDAQEAVNCYQKALSIQPNHLKTWVSLGNLLLEHGVLHQAIHCYEQALGVDNSYPEIHSNLGKSYAKLSRHAEAERCYRHAVELAPQRMDLWSNLLLSLHYNPSNSAAQIQTEFTRWAAGPMAEITPATLLPREDLEQGPLHVGLLSSHFKRHPTLWLSLPAWERLNPQQVRLTIYHNGQQQDPFTERLRAVAAQWREIHALPDAQVIRQIREDKLDLFMDLSGHSQGRLSIAAHRVAPVQVKWVGGLFNTTGLATMDWLLADGLQIRPQDEPWYVERIHRMPHGYVVYEAPTYAPAVNPLPALESGHITFGCFNNPKKLNPTILTVWAQILRSLPHSRLLLKGDAYRSEESRKGILQQLMQAGVNQEQIIFAPRSPHAELLATYQQVDIALDPWPYSGGLTTCEALWMGVPVITLPGPTFAGRHSASHLHHVGLGGWIVESQQAYIAQARHWAQNLAALAQLRQGLRAQVARSPLCDADQFAQDLTHALRHMAMHPK